ncbi:MAG TPA: biotin--[acetyl-CoA-carboxylase] ligase [Verrucomicrobiaceae bacterium]|jgi:BirA family biotin operon repressor/biotin-[acetyl-CoA-carboxylase] ligase
MSAPSGTQNPLDVRRLRAALAGHAIGCEVEVHEELTSTSDRVRELGDAGHSHGLVVFAESQTAGRGRRDNRWSAMPRHDLLFSVLLRPRVGVEKSPRLATLAALGLSRGVESAGKFAPQIKWPNDLLLNRKKFCGILAEMFGAPAGSFLVLGVGMNVNGAEFPPEIAELATSLRLESGGKLLDRTALAIALLRALQQALDSWDAGFDRIIAEVTRRSFLLGQRMRARAGSGMIEGVAHGLGGEGGLIVRRDDGTLLELTSAEEVRLA